MIHLPDLEGRWSLTREIEDRRAGLTGRFEGEARWLPDADGLRQEEDGVLRYGTAAPMRARRVYLWRSRGDEIRVLFEDGRPFHVLAPGEAQDRHLCPPDTYDVTYELSAWPRWSQVWHVTGPRKDAVIRSWFER